MLRDIAVAGAGVAGLSIAALLQRAGFRVLLFDKLAAPAPVGSGLILQHTGRTVLRELGLEKSINARGAQIDRLSGLSVPAMRRALDVRFSAIGEGKHGVAIHRAALFHILNRCAQDAGAAFTPSFRVASIETVSGGKVRLVSSTGETSPKADLIIDALGANSPLAGPPPEVLSYGALWATVEYRGDGAAANIVREPALEQRYYRAAKMAGVMPVGTLADGSPPLAAFFWSLKNIDFENWKQKGLARWKEDVLSLWPETEAFLAQIEHADDLTFARYAHRTMDRPYSPGVVHIGDAYHSTSPQLGQGANMALLDAYALSRALTEHVEVESAVRAFAEARRAHVRLYQAMSRLFTPVYQSDSRTLAAMRDILAPLASKTPFAPKILAAMVAGSIGAPLARLGLR